MGVPRVSGPASSQAFRHPSSARAPGRTRAGARCAGPAGAVQSHSVPAPHEIRADHDATSIVVYQAYGPAIADAALRAGRFVAPFSRKRMTWIEPSLLRLMARSGWGRKANQERTLAVRITRVGWEEALSRGVLTSFSAGTHASREAWRTAFDRSSVHVRWDPERSLRGAKLPHRSIQVVAHLEGKDPVQLLLAGLI